MQGGLGGGLRRPRATPPTTPLQARLPPAARPRVRRGRGPGDVHRRLPPDGALRAPPIALRVAEHHRPPHGRPGRRPPARPPEDVDRRIGLPGRRARCDRRQRMARRPPGARGRRPHRRPPGRGGGCRPARGDRRRDRGAALQVPRRRRGPPRDGPRLRGGRPDAGRAAQHVQEQPAAGHEDAPRIPCGRARPGSRDRWHRWHRCSGERPGRRRSPSGARPMDLRASDGRTPGTRATGG